MWIWGWNFWSPFASFGSVLPMGGCAGDQRPGEERRYREREDTGPFRIPPAADTAMLAALVSPGPPSALSTASVQKAGQGPTDAVPCVGPPATQVPRMVILSALTYSQVFPWPQVW